MLNGGKYLKSRPQHKGGLRGGGGGGGGCKGGGGGGVEGVD